MIETQSNRILSVVPPGAIIDNNTFTSTVIDTVGFGYTDVIVHLGATDVAMAALKLQESDLSGSGFADVPGAIFGAAGAPALPVATDDNKLFAFHVKRGSRKRYLKLVATAGDGAVGTYLTAFAILSRASDMPDTASERGFAQEVFV